MLVARIRFPVLHAKGRSSLKLKIGKHPIEEEEKIAAIFGFLSFMVISAFQRLVTLLRSS